MATAATSGLGAVGSAVSTQAFDVYGNPTTANGTLRPALGYASQYLDQESGVQYLRARYYEPATGQFLTEDPLVASTQEAYGYGSGNPISLSDPSGLDGDAGHFLRDHGIDTNKRSLVEIVKSVSDCDVSEWIRGITGELDSRWDDLTENDNSWTSMTGEDPLMAHIGRYDKARDLLEMLVNRVDGRFGNGFDPCSGPTVREVAQAEIAMGRGSGIAAHQVWKDGHSRVHVDVGPGVHVGAAALRTTVVVIVGALALGAAAAAGGGTLNPAG